MSVTHRSCSIAAEGSFGSLDANGIPSPSGLTYLSLPAERDPVVIPGAAPVNERPILRDGPFGYQAELDTVWSGSNRLQKRTGDVSIKIDLTTLGSSANTYDATGLGLLLGAGFKRVTAGRTTGDSVAVTSVNVLVPTDETEWPVGGVVSSLIGGRAEYSAVTSNDRGGLGTSLGISPAISSFASPITLQPMETFYTPTGTASGAVKHSVTFRIDGVNFRSYAFGCKMSSMKISLTGGRAIAEFIYTSAFIIDDHDDSLYSTGLTLGPIEPVFLNGAAQHFRASYAVLSASAPTTTTDLVGNIGDELGRVVANTDTFDLTVTNTLTPVGVSDSVLGMSDMEVSDVAVVANLSLSSPLSTVKNDFRDQVSRQLMIGTGPTGDGLGCGFLIPSAYLTVDPTAYDVSGDLVMQNLSYAQGRFGGDVGSGVCKNSPFRMGLGI